MSTMIGIEVSFRPVVPARVLLNSFRRNVRERHRRGVEVALAALQPDGQVLDVQTMTLVPRHIVSGLVPHSEFPGARVTTVNEALHRVEVIFPGETLHGDMDFILLSEYPR